MKSLFYGKTGKWLRRGLQLAVDLLLLYLAIQLAVSIHLMINERAYLGS